MKLIFDGIIDDVCGGGSAEWPIELKINRSVSSEMGGSGKKGKH